MVRLDVGIPPAVGRQKRELERWLAAKKSGIGGSSAAVALGMGRWGSRARLWAEMTGKEGFGQSAEETERMLWGTLLEGRVLRETARRTKTMLVRAAGQRAGLECPACELVDVYSFKKEGGQPLLRSKVRPWQHYSLDGLLCVPQTGELILAEAKTTSSHLAESWDGEDPPEEVFVQVHHGFAVTGLKRAYVSVLIGGQELRVFEVARDESIVKQVTAGEEKFLDYVKTNRMPPVEKPLHPDTLDVLKRLHPNDNGQTVYLPAAEAIQLDRELELLKARIKVDTARQDGIKAQFRAWLADATFGQIEGADFMYSLKTIAVKAEEDPRPAYTKRELRRKELR